MQIEAIEGHSNSDYDKVATIANELRAEAEYYYFTQRAKCSTRVDLQLRLLFGLRVKNFRKSAKFSFVFAMEVRL